MKEVKREAALIPAASTANYKFAMDRKAPGELNF
jgi:hypothetical protein